MANNVLYYMATAKKSSTNKRLDSLLRIPSGESKYVLDSSVLIQFDSKRLNESISTASGIVAHASALSDGVRYLDAFAIAPLTTAVAKAYVDVFRALEKY